MYVDETKNTDKKSRKQQICVGREEKTFIESK